MPASSAALIYQRVIEDVLKAMGRTDVAVDEVSVTGAEMLSAALTRGLRTKRIAVPLERLVDRREVGTAIKEALEEFFPRPDRRDSPSAAVPETRFQDKDRHHRGGAKFD